MRDVVERAKDSLNNYDYAHAYGCDPGYPVGLIRSLLAEVERLRGLVIDTVAVAVQRGQRLDAIDSDLPKLSTRRNDG